MYALTDFKRLELVSKQVADCVTTPSELPSFYRTFQPLLHLSFLVVDGTTTHHHAAAPLEASGAHPFEEEGSSA